MKQLIVAATLEELILLFDHFNFPHQSFVQGEDFDVLITGVGMTATAFSLGRYLSNDYNLVVNLGIAGAFDRNIPLGSVLNVQVDVFADLGAENKEDFISIDQLGFGKSTYKSINTIDHPQVNKLTKVNGATVNKVHGNNNSIIQLITRLNPQTESMEGAAVFYCCEQLSVPCLQVRGISNYVEERNKDNWKIALAVKNINQWAIDFMTPA